jgi:hypothetical protein
MSDYVARNERVFTELEAVIERLAYGKLDISMDINNRRITKLTIFGQKRDVYNKGGEDELVREIGKRLKSSLDSKEDTTLSFTIKTRNGSPEEALWLSELTRNYDRLDSCK